MAGPPFEISRGGCKRKPAGTRRWDRFPKKMNDIERDALDRFAELLLGANKEKVAAKDALSAQGYDLALFEEMARAYALLPEAKRRFDFALTPGKSDLVIRRR